MESLDKLFEETLRDIYYAEKALLKNLPKMARKASSDALASAFDDHIAETEGQVERLEQIFEMIDKAPRGKRCPAIDKSGGGSRGDHARGQRRHGTGCRNAGCSAGRGTL